MPRSSSQQTCAALMLSMLCAANAHAVVQRTFVASNGQDTNPCSLQLPCRSFAMAMANTASDGEVIVLDSAGYGPVAITQNVAIIAPPGIYAGISVPGPAPAISINSARVVLEGLTINGIGGTVGVQASTNSEIFMSHCAIANLATGIDLASSSAYVDDTDLRDLSVAGVSVTSSSLAILSNVRLVNAAVGVRTDAGTVTIVKSALSGGATGISAGGNAGTSDMVAVYRSLISGMSADGIKVNASGAGATTTVDVLLSTVARNTGDGIAVSTTSPGSATVVVADSQLTQNAYAIRSDLGTGASTTLSNRNTIANNASGGLKAVNAGVIHTRGNNSGEQINATSGTTLVPGF